MNTSTRWSPGVVNCWRKTAGTSSPGGRSNGSSSPRTPSAVSRARTPSARAAPKLRKVARIKTGAPTVTTGTSSFRSVTARFSPPDFPRSITTDRGRLASSRATARLERVGRLGRRPPARGLQVGQENDLLLGDRRDVEDAVDLLEGGRQIGAAVGLRQLADLFLDFAQVVASGRRSRPWAGCPS